MRSPGMVQVRVDRSISFQVASKVSEVRAAHKIVNSKPSWTGSPKNRTGTMRRTGMWKSTSWMRSDSRLLDRLLHHGRVLTCGPRSWRTKLHTDLRSQEELR